MMAGKDPVNLTMFDTAHFDSFTRVCRQSDLHHVFARNDDWPMPEMTAEENAKDLQRHQAEFENRLAFAYVRCDSLLWIENCAAWYARAPPVCEWPVSCHMYCARVFALTRSICLGYSIAGLLVPWIEGALVREICAADRKHAMKLLLVFLRHTRLAL
jgi:hypothetical protein